MTPIKEKNPDWPSIDDFNKVFREEDQADRRLKKVKGILSIINKIIDIKSPIGFCY